MTPRLSAVTVLAVLVALIPGCTTSQGHVSSGARSATQQAVRVNDAAVSPTLSERQATVIMLNSNTPPPLPEAGTGIVRQVRVRFGSARIASTVAHSSATRLIYGAAWIAEWDERAGDNSLCPNPKQPPDPAPPGPVHRAFVVSDDGDAGTIYQDATINCGVAHPPSAAPASETLSVPWRVSRQSRTAAVLTFSYPSCGTPAGGQGRNGRWFVLIDVPLGVHCGTTMRGAQSYVGRQIPQAGRTGVVRETTTDPLAPPVPE